MKRIWVFFFAFAILGAPLAAKADEPPQISAAAEPRDVQVGEPFVVQLSVTVDSNSPSPGEPHLALPDGLRAGPPSTSTQTQINLINGRLTRRSGITATWQVLASREGVFVVTPDITWNGRKVSANALRITVHPAGAPGAPGRSRPQRGNPFDPFGMLPRGFPGFPGGFEPPDSPSEPEPVQDPELAMDAPLDSKVFLRSVVDEKNPVVGQQVTMTIYVYARVTSLELTDVHEPSIPDFFRRDLIAPNTQPDPRAVMINGVLWRAQPIFKVALFPLKAGDLEIGPMQATVLGGRGSGLTGASRQSQPLKVHVSEPPARGRPVGYLVGDVGAYTLTATVDPRKAEVGGAIAVTVTVAGVGNVPNNVRVPASSSFEWLPPQVRENIEVENGKVRGSRTFAYLVRPKVEGPFDLGELTLPFWNPERKVYDIARVPLGKVQIEADKSQPPGSPPPPAPHDPWSSLGAARTQLGAVAPQRDPLTETAWYWTALFGLPLAVVLGALGTRGAQKFRARLSARGASAERTIDDALSEARRASKSGDRGAVAASIDRAMHLAIERATGLRARALLAREVTTALEQRQVPADLASQTSELLSTVETVRFSHDPASDLGGLVERAAELVRKFGRLSIASLFALIMLLARATSAADEPPEALFQKGAAALAEGETVEAVETFEALADRGFVHPDASFDRALSYLGRVRAGVEKPGDLGRAAAALEETLLGRPDDRDAESALELVRAEVARRRARSGASADVESRPTLERAVVGLASEGTWSILAALSSALLTLGLVLRLVATSRSAVPSDAPPPSAEGGHPAHDGALYLASSIAIPIGAVALLAFATLAGGARHFRLTTQEGVVVASPEAHLVTERGVLTPGSIPEAARVEVGEQRGALVQVRWGALEGWTQSDAVRRLARP